MPWVPVALLNEPHKYSGETKNKNITVLLWRESFFVIGAWTLMFRTLFRRLNNAMYFNGGNSAFRAFFL